MKKKALLAALILTSVAPLAVMAQTVPQTVATETPGTISAPMPNGLPAAPATATATDALATPPSESQQAVDYSWVEYKNPYIGEQNSLENPNRTADEITAWVQQVATDCLTLTPEGLNQEIADAKKYFVDKGWAEYAGYMRQAQLIERVRSQNVKVNTVANGEPNILASEAVAGAYRWLIETPILISFMRKDFNGEDVASGTAKFKLTMQIARVEQGKGDDGMAIESWKVVAEQ